MFAIDHTDPQRLLDLHGEVKCGGVVGGVGDEGGGHEDILLIEFVLGKIKSTPIATNLYSVNYYLI